MSDADFSKSQVQLLEELRILRQRLAVLEAGELAAQSEASAEQLRQVIQNMPVMMLAYDEARDKIVVWNLECEHVPAA